MESKNLLNLMRHSYLYIELILTIDRFRSHIDGFVNNQKALLDLSPKKQMPISKSKKFEISRVFPKISVNVLFKKLISAN